jgi:hypothetical protein
MRSIVFSKSLALTGVPSEYLTPWRRWNVYCRPPFSGCGTLSASPGTSCDPSLPVASLYASSGV